MSKLRAHATRFQVTGYVAYLLATCALISLLSVSTAQPASAFSIELTGAAPDRIERQRNEALGRLPLPGTPDLSRRAERLAAAGLSLGDEVFLRIFKASSELELWMRKGDRFIKFATYPICFWSGGLGPKLTEGDKQTPEGLYTITRKQLHWTGRHPRSLNLGFPNHFDRANERTGSYILVHGSCSSVGCYAMTNVVVEEIFDIVEAAIRKGQTHVHVQSLPFRLTEENLAQQAFSPWLGFWRSLKPAYDAFEATHNPPLVGVCDRDYAASPTPPGEGNPGPLASCGARLAPIAATPQRKASADPTPQ